MIKVIIFITLKVVEGLGIVFIPYYIGVCHLWIGNYFGYSLNFFDDVIQVWFLGWFTVLGPPLFVFAMIFWVKDNLDLTNWISKKLKRKSGRKGINNENNTY